MTVAPLPVHRAVFGDVKGAHNLIAASPGIPAQLLSELAAHYTDRLLPTEFPWDPYECGFPLLQHYVLTRTFPVKASRGGMVQTHVVMVDLQRAGELFELVPLAALLPQAPVPLDQAAQPLRGAAIAVDAHGNAVPAPPGYLEVVRKMLDGAMPVWVGQAGFWDIVTQLWRQLWPAARRELRFRVCSNRNDLAEWPATLACTLKELRSNWDDRAFINQTLIPSGPFTTTEAYLLGLPEGQALASARDRLDFSPTTVKDLKKLEQYVSMLENGSVEGIRSAFRLLGQIAPDPSHLPSEKQAVVARLAALTLAGSQEEVLGLRNVNVAPFQTALAVLQAAISEWLSRCIARRGGGLGVATSIFRGTDAWAPIAQPALLAAFTPWRAECAGLLWSWWIEDPELVAPSAELMPADGTIEQDLVDRFPNELPVAVHNPLFKLAYARGWYVLHAATLSACVDDPAQARLRAQITFESNVHHLEGLEYLARALLPSDLVEAAIAIDDPRMVQLAARALHRDPALLSALDTSVPKWRALWYAVVEAGHELYDGISNPAHVAALVLDAAVSGGALPPGLLNKIVTDARSNLAGYARRREIWPVLSVEIKGRALACTAESWRQQFLSDPTFDSQPLEPELEAEVLYQWRDSAEGATVTDVTRMHSRFEALSETDLVSWLGGPASVPSQIDAHALGQLIFGRRWQSAAEKVGRLVLDYRDDFSVAVHQCAGLLGVVLRAKVAQRVPEVTINVDDWWAEWVNISCVLFRRGVSDNNIWADAAGDLSLIPEDSGRQEWMHALSLLRNGGAGAVTIEGLLHQMRNKFYANRDLKALEYFWNTKLRHE